MHPYKGPAKYNKYGYLVLNEPLIIYNKNFIGMDFVIDKVLEIKDGFITIYSEFEWNGCTFAMDGERDKDGLPSSWKASCIHDALYRYDLIPMKRTIKDKIFYDLLVEVKFKIGGIPMAGLYYVCVLCFGGISLYLIRKFRELRGI